MTTPSNNFNDNDPYGLNAPAPPEGNAGKPIINNPDGSFSTERTITVGVDGKFVNIPTIVDGQQRTQDEAIKLYQSGGNPAVGEYKTEPEAINAAQARSNQIGVARSGEAQALRTEDDPYGLAASKTAPSDPYGLTKKQTDKKSLISELGSSIGQFVSDTANAPISTIKAANRDLLTFKSLVESTGYNNAARSWAQEFRSKAGLPTNPAEDAALASSIAEYKRAHPNDPWVKRAEENLRSVSVLTKDQKHALDRGLGNIASMASGSLIGKGVGVATSVIPNELARRIAAIEAHSIASMVAYDVSNSIANEEAVTPESVGQSAAIGAAFPIVSKVFGKTAGAVVKGGAKLVGSTVGAAGASLDKALAHVKIYNAVTDMMKGANDALFISGEGLLRKYGLDETADQLVSVRGRRHILGATWNARVAAATRGLVKSDRDLVGRLLHEDEITPLLMQGAKDAPGVQRAVKEIASVLTRVGSLAEKAGLVVGDSDSGQLYRFVRRKDFGMPHVFVNTDEFMVPGKLRDEALDSIKKTVTKEGWKPGPKETLDQHAQDILERIHLRQSGEYEEAIRKFGKKFSGTVQVWGRHYNLPGYHLDPSEVLPSYLEKMSRNITQAIAFGPEPDAKIASRSVKDIYPGAFTFLDKITDPDTRNRLEAVITRQLGAGFKEPSARMKKASATLQQFQAVTKLGLAQIAQTAQLITPNLQTGFKGAVKDFSDLMKASPALKDALLRTGSFTQSLVRDVEEKMYSGSKEGVFDTSKVLSRTGFTGLDTLARKYGALRGWSFASYQAEEAFRLAQRLPKASGMERTYIESKLKKIESKLVDLGIDTQKLYKNGGVLDPEDYLKAGQKVSTDWNFWGDSMSLPAFWNSPAGKVLTQFKSFAYQQSIALKKHVVKPALDGDLQPLIRLLIAGQISGEVINDMRALARGKPRNEKTRIFDNYAALGLLSIWGDTMQAAEKKDWLAGFLAGPTGSDIVDAGTAIGEAIHGKPKHLLKKTIQTLGPMIPGIGPLATPAVVNALFPPASKGQ